MERYKAPPEERRLWLVFAAWFVLSIPLMAVQPLGFLVQVVGLYFGWRAWQLRNATPRDPNESAGNNPGAL